MKKLIILTVILVSMVMATAALAGPGANSPWVPVDNDGDGKADFCSHPSDPTSLESGVLYYNTNSGNVHCFKAKQRQSQNTPDCLNKTPRF